MLNANPLKKILSDEFNPSPLYHKVRHIYHDLQVRRRQFPRTTAEMRESALYRAWWYYAVELFPGLLTKGIFPEDLPMLPRILMRDCALDDMECLDMGSMEGIMPVLMCRQGARRVLATDAVFHCYEKLMAVKRCYGVDFDFRQVGLMYDLSSKLRNAGGFDFINLSGLLYHVFSPIQVLAGVRPLLKKNGLMIVSTNVVNRPGFSMEFNDRGKLQDERNTFWYFSIPLFDYLLRYFQLAPLECRYMPRTTKPPVPADPQFDAGYLSVVCRATEDVALPADDAWAAESMRISWETTNLLDRKMLARQPLSPIRYKKQLDPRCEHPERGSIDLYQAVNQRPPLTHVQASQDTHMLKLEDWS